MSLPQRGHDPNCGKPGHISLVCDRNQNFVGTACPTPIGAIHPDVGNVIDYDQVFEHPEVTPRLLVTLTHLNGSFKFSCFPDTGSGTSVISSNLATSHSLCILPRSSGISIIAVNGHQLHIDGVVVLNVHEGGGNKLLVPFVVTPDITNEIILGYGDLCDLGIISENFPISSVNASLDKDARSFNIQIEKLKEKLLSEFPEVLSGTLPQKPMAGEAMEIFLNDCHDISPTNITTARLVPLNFEDEADGLVQKLLDEGIIAKVKVPTAWCSLAFFVWKPGGGLRLVTDYTGLNKHVRRLIHPFPSTKDIIAGLNPKAKVYAKLDALSGYFQVPLSENASFLTTFLLPSGMFRYLRAPMGLSSSSDEFCRRLDAVFARIPGIRKLVDDILVEGNDLQDLENKICMVLQHCVDHGFVLSSKKFEIGSSVDFAGYIISSKGIQPSPKRLEALSSFLVPKDVTGVRSFLGLCNQLEASFLTWQLSHNPSPVC